MCIYAKLTLRLVSEISDSMKLVDILISKNKALKILYQVAIITIYSAMIKYYSVKHFK